MRSERRLGMVIVMGALLATAPAAACTSFCMDTPDGPVFGFNLDLFIPGDGHLFVNRRGIAKEGYAAGTTGAKARWVSRYGSVTFNVAGLEFAVAGLNEAGLAVSGMELRAGRYPPPDATPPVGNATWVQYVLDTCGSVADAVRLVPQVRIEDTARPNHYLVADAQGGVAVFEWLDGELLVYTGVDLPVPAAANMRYARAAEAAARGGPRWWWSNPGASAERVIVCRDRMAAFDAAVDTAAVDHAFGTLLQVAAPHTRWSIVMDLAARRVWYGTVRSGSLKHVALADFDLACDAPRLMLDVNADLGGDVAGAFGPYDHDANLAVFRNLCARYGVEVSAADAAGIVALVEGFGCAR